MDGRLKGQILELLKLFLVITNLLLIVVMVTGVVIFGADFRLLFLLFFDWSVWAVHNDELSIIKRGNILIDVIFQGGVHR